MRRSHRRDLNPRPHAYEACALPLSYGGKILYEFLFNFFKRVLFLAALAHNLLFLPLADVRSFDFFKKQRFYFFPAKVAFHASDPLEVLFKSFSTRPSML